MDGFKGRGEGEIKAAAADGIEEGVGARGEEKDDGAERGFFEGFEEGVGGGGVHAVGFVDEGDFTGTFAGGELDFFNQFAGVLYVDLPHFINGAEGKEVGVVIDVGVIIFEDGGGEFEGDFFEDRNRRAAQDDSVAETVMSKSVLQNLERPAIF